MNKHFPCEILIQTLQGKKRILPSESPPAQKKPHLANNAAIVICATNSLSCATANSSWSSASVSQSLVSKTSQDTSNNSVAGTTCKLVATTNEVIVKDKTVVTNTKSNVSVPQVATAGKATVTVMGTPCVFQTAAAITVASSKPLALATVNVRKMVTNKRITSTSAVVDVSKALVSTTNKAFVAMPINSGLITPSSVNLIQASAHADSSAASKKPHSVIPPVADNTSIPDIGSIKALSANNSMVKAVSTLMVDAGREVKKKVVLKRNVPAEILLGSSQPIYAASTAKMPTVPAIVSSSGSIQVASSHPQTTSGLIR